ncbi:hypothetical protein AWV80_19435 [Cupriavidus sp. UYMU48A]|nr:hypothetical protein AWV80_19435 [Cupriavidus sp. UYMU48A]
MLGHPGVWPWFRQVLEDAKIDPETVISLRVADGIKMRLDIGAETRPCPDCKYAHCHSEADDEEDKALDVDDAPRRATLRASLTGCLAHSGATDPMRRDIGTSGVEQLKEAS